MKYLLDTNILSELLKKRPSPHLVDRLRSRQPRSLCTSCICVMELRFGAALRGDADIFWEKITEEILSKVTILPLESREAATAGSLLDSFQKAGQMIGTEDILIASTALEQGCVMVTGNVRHFSRVKDLRVENWLEP